MKRSVNFKSYFLQDINPVIRFLVFSDTVIVGSSGLLVPIFAIFIEDSIVGGSAAVAGVAAGIYLFTKSVMQIPIAHFIDRIRGEKDDFWLMFSFTMAVSLLPLSYLMISTPWQLYLTQFFLGICMAFTFPTFMALFTRHIDRDKEGTEWGIYYTLTDISSAVFAMLGGYVAASQGFPTLIISVVIISSLGTLLLYPIKAYIKMPPKRRRH